MDVPGPAPRVLGPERHGYAARSAASDLVTGGLSRDGSGAHPSHNGTTSTVPTRIRGWTTTKPTPQQRSGPHLAAQQRGEELLVPRRQEPPAPAQPLRTAGVRQRRRRELLGDPDDPPVIDAAGVAA